MNNAPRPAVLSVAARYAVLGVVCVMLSACISGVKPADTYTDSAGKTTVFETGRESCTSSCNEDESKCMESDSAQDNSGINGPRGMFGASAECRNDLKSCLASCKAQ
jgi:hypothetical protein